MDLKRAFPSDRARDNKHKAKEQEQTVAMEPGNLISCARGFPFI